MLILRRDQYSVVLPISDIWPHIYFLFHKEPFKKPGWVANFKSHRDVPWIKAAAAIIEKIPTKSRIEIWADRIQFTAIIGSFILALRSHTLFSPTRSWRWTGWRNYYISPWHSWIITMITVEALDRQFGISSSLWTSLAASRSETHFTKGIWAHNWNLLKLQAIVLWNSTIPSGQTFYLYRDSWASERYAKFWPVEISIFQARATHMFARFWLWAHLPFVKWWPNKTAQDGESSKRHKKILLRIEPTRSIITHLLLAVYLILSQK